MTSSTSTQIVAGPIKVIVCAAETTALLNLETVPSEGYPDYYPFINQLPKKHLDPSGCVYAYPTKIFINEIDDNEITCNDIGYYVVNAKSGECRQVINAVKRHSKNDLVGVTVFSIGTAGFSAVEYGHVTQLTDVSKKVLDEYLRELRENLDVFQQSSHEEFTVT